MTQSGIFSMLAELQDHKRDRALLQRIFIQDRLDKAVSSYYEDLRKSYETLKIKNEIHVLRKLNK